MPTYEFVCTKCNNVFDIEKKMNEIKEQEPCPRCGYIAGRIWCDVPTVFKTDGFYSSDNRKE